MKFQYKISLLTFLVIFSVIYLLNEKKGLVDNQKYVASPIVRSQNDQELKIDASQNSDDQIKEVSIDSIVSPQEITKMLDDEEFKEKLEQFERLFSDELRQDIQEYNSKISQLDPDRSRLKTLDKTINELTLAGKILDDNLLEERYILRQKLISEAQDLGEIAVELAAKIREEKELIREQYFQNLAQIDKQEN